MLKHETDLRAVCDMLVAEVTREPLGVRAELDATQHRLEKVRRMAAAAAVAALVPATGVLQAQSSQSPDLFHRANPWSGTDEAGSQCWFQTSQKRLFAVRAGVATVNFSRCRRLRLGTVRA